MHYSGSQQSFPSENEKSRTLISGLSKKICLLGHFGPQSYGIFFVQLCHEIGALIAFCQESETGKQAKSPMIRKFALKRSEVVIKTGNGTSKRKGTLQIGKVSREEITNNIKSVVVSYLYSLLSTSTNNYFATFQGDFNEAIKRNEFSFLMVDRTRKRSAHVYAHKNNGKLSP